MQVLHTNDCTKCKYNRPIYCAKINFKCLSLLMYSNWPMKSLLYCLNRNCGAVPLLSGYSGHRIRLSGKKKTVEV